MNFRATIVRIQFRIGYGFFTTICGALVGYWASVAPLWVSIIAFVVYLIIVGSFLLGDERRIIEQEQDRIKAEPALREADSIRRELGEKEKKEYFQNFELITAALDELTT